jgi:hypothetical protein
MQTQHIALVPEVAGVNASELARVSAAIQKQILRDVAPIWQIKATVDAFPHLEDVPVGYWPVILAFGELGSDEGVHCDRKGQPYALIEMSPSWSLTASHVCIEMLIDPHGNRTVVGPSPRSDQGSVEFQVDICDPCEDARYGYTVNDVLVSDFCTPEFLAQGPSGKERYSFTGAVEAPYQVLPGGRLTWYDPATNRWWQRNHFGGAARDTDLGPLERRAWRGFGVNHPRAPKHLQATKMTLEAFESRMGIQRARALHASQSQAHLLRVHLGNPAGVGDLTIEGTAPTGGALGNPRPTASDRPQVLAALIKASVSAASAADPSARRRSLAEALATTEERAVVGATEPPLPDATLPSARHSDPAGFEAIEDTVAYRDAKAAPSAPPTSNPLPPPTPPPMPGRAQGSQRTSDPAPGGEAFAPRPSRGAMDRRQTVRSAQAWDPPPARTTIPPPGPIANGPSVARAASHSRSARAPGHSGSPGRTTARSAPSVAPTSMNVATIPPVRPQSSLRDKVLLAGAVGAAGLAAIALFGSSGAPTQAPASAASMAPPPALSAAVGPTPPAAAPATSAPPADSAAAKPAESTAPSAAQSPAPPHPPAARAPQGPRPKITAGQVKTSDNPYDSPPESMDKLVEERR